MVGPYFAFKRNTDDQIRLVKLIKDPKEKKAEEVHVDLANMFSADSDCKYVNFFKVPECAY